MYKLENEFISLEVTEKGAELCSVIDKNTGFEFIHDGNPKYWSRHAPHLFPIVGRLLDDSYTYKGKSYNMGQHGFARDMDFKLIAQKEGMLVLELLWSKESLKIYPFKFKLRVIYTLSNNQVGIGYVVTNVDTNEMLFSIGAHPAFRFEEDQSIEDYKIVFEPKVKDLQLELKAPYYTGNIVGSGIEMSELKLNMEMFKDDVLVFNQDINSVSLKSRKSNHKVEVHTKGIPYIGLWTNYNASKNCPFLCIEPWDGLADFNDHDQDLENKRTIRSIKGGEVFEFSYMISFEK